jgi:hypothetical protein
MRVTNSKWQWRRRLLSSASTLHARCAYLAPGDTGAVCAYHSAGGAVVTMAPEYPGSEYRERPQAKWKSNSLFRQQVEQRLLPVMGQQQRHTRVGRLQDEWYQQIYGN